MSNNNHWTKNKNSNKESQRGGKGQHNRGGYNRRQQRPRSDRKRQSQFPKFADTDHINNQSNHWPKNDWNCDNGSSHNYAGNGSVGGSGIYPWVRQNPVNPLIIPHINFERQYQETPTNNTIENKPTEPAPVVTGVDKEMTCKNNSAPAKNPFSEPTVTSKLPSEANLAVKIKKEKDLLVNVKRERKSSSSSSSKSSECTSNEEEPESKSKPVVAEKTETTSSKPPSLPLNIKLKPKDNPINSPTSSSASSSTSSASSSSDEEPEPVPSTSHKSAPSSEKLQPNIKKVKTKCTTKKNNSEDDVVCMGKLENKIVLEDDDDETAEDYEETEKKNSNKKVKKLSKKTTAEKCMICDKKGHTSFQCQMICKNCSTPYHGYRTCPQPVNLSTMLQLFIEFCMQQFQNFNASNPYDKISKSRAESMHLISASNKSNKTKRKANETTAKTKASKKRKISSGSKKNKSKSDSEDSTDDDNAEGNTDSDTSSTEPEEDISDSTAESLVSHKRKRKTKSKIAPKANPVSMPIVLNGFPNLTVPASSIQNPGTSSNALNTLLLTHMFQNAIGSLKK